MCSTDIVCLSSRFGQAIMPGVTTMDCRPYLGLLYLIAFIAVLSAVTVSPMLIEPGSAVNLDGRVGRMDHAVLWSEMGILPGSIYSMGDYLCHQMGDRSLWINGSQLPICIREYVLLIGATVGAAICFWISSFIDGNTKRATLFALAMVMISPAEWAVSEFCGYDPGMEVISAVSILSGVGFAILIHCIMAMSFHRATRRAVH